MNEEEYWKKRSHVEWLKSRDRNTTFFHAVVKGRHRKNTILSIRNGEGRIVSEQVGMMGTAEKYFGEIFRTRGGGEDFSALGDLTHELLNRSGGELDREFSEEEVYRALKEMHPK
ncbi:hypothetical protein Scep_012596 [Stephania cephalantha]|uniref:Uncharacterized protein n=1 Tax=Stephania cephalantha TaxID=152367 RepID=A0AAP0JH53_9MAGN